MKRWALVLALPLAVACGQGGAHGPGSAHRFAHCMSGAPPADRRVVASGLTLTVEGGVVRIASPHEVRIGVTTKVAGASSMAGDFDLLVVLGGLGADTRAVSASVRALAATNRVVLLVLGGDDDPAAVHEQLESHDSSAGHSPVRDRVLDVSAARSVEVGAHQFVTVPGAPAGRYARSAHACGFDASDLDARAATLGPSPPHGHRHLLAWAAPAGIDLARGIDGVDAGDPDLAAFAHRIGAAGGFFAWPAENADTIAGRGAAIRVVARPLAGPAAERSDGTRVLPGAPIVIAGDTPQPESH